MTIAVITLSTLLFVATVTIVWLFLRLIETQDKLEEVVDQVEESLDVLDTCHRRFYAVSQTPLLSEEPVVRQLMDDVRSAQHAVLLIANKIVTFSQEDDDNEGQDQSA